MVEEYQGAGHGRHHPRPDDDPRRGRQPALQLGPGAAGARHHGCRLRGAGRLPAAASLPARPREAGAGEIRAWLAARLRRQQYPLLHLDQDRRVGARQAVPLGADHAHQQRSDPVGFRLGGGAPQALHAVAQAGELQGRPDRPARHGQSRVRPDGAPRQGDRVAAQGSRRRKDAGRRRHHRAADDVRTAKGRAEGRRRPAGHAGSARDQDRPTRSRCSTAPPPWSTAPIT